ncbi:MAG: hypothetical protein JNK75_04420 [Betaproteobacteria bacterium]|nr:hypothetical protein [Betaproteobacteria bacterium]
MNNFARGPLLAAAATLLLVAGAGSAPVQAAGAPGVKSAPVHRAGHAGVRHHGHHPRRWSGSVYLGPSWGFPWWWGSPALSIGYWGRHGGISVPMVPISESRFYVNRELEEWDEDAHTDRDPRRAGPTPVYVRQEKSPTDELAITPTRGQSMTQQSFDRIDCERAGIKNTGYEPSAPGAGAVKKADWVKDVAACMSGKGYSVK